MPEYFRLSAADRSAQLRIVIHGGMHKTGTTSVQNYFHNNREPFLQQGIAYPAQEVSQALLLNPKHKHWSPDGCTQQLHLARQAGASTLLMSAEIVSTLGDEQFRKLTQCFGGYDVTYVFCFRNWREYLPSRWNQYCRRRDSQSFGSYFYNVLNSDHVDLRYDKILSRAANSGKCRVVAISYDNAMISDQTIIPVVLRAAGLPDCSLKTTDFSIYRQNTRLPQNEAELVRLINGIVASRLRLSQNDLYNSFNEYRMCADYFDFFNVLEMIEDNIKFEFDALIAAQVKTVTIPAEWKPQPMLALRDLHTHRFINKIDNNIFPTVSETKIEYSALHWSEVPPSLEATILRLTKDR